MCISRIITQIKLKKSLPIERIAFIHKGKEYAGALSSPLTKASLNMQCLSDERLSFANPLNDYINATNPVGFFCFASHRNMMKYKKRFLGCHNIDKNTLLEEYNMRVEFKIMKYIIPKGTIITIAREEKDFNGNGYGNVIISPALINPRVKKFSRIGIDEFISNKEEIKTNEILQT